MKRGILFTGGCSPSIEYVNKLVLATDLICAADSGLDYLSQFPQLKPHAIVGDMDSILQETIINQYPKAILERYSHHKDKSDTEIGWNWLSDQNCTELILIGGGEGRLDHTLALVSIFHRDKAPRFWYTRREAIQLIHSSTTLKGRKGDRVSFLPVGIGPWRVESEGLIWNLNSVKWSAHYVSLSNCMTSSEVKLSLIHGKILVIRPIGDVLSK